MQFTRQPIVETIITPKEGYKLQVKSSQREYLVDALELILYGAMPFYRSCEVSQPFVIPAADFEVTQVREARLPLKHATYERAKMSREPTARETKRPSSPTSSPPKEREEIKATLDSDGTRERRRRPRRKHLPEESRPSPNVPKKHNSDVVEPLPKSLSPTTASEGPIAYDMVPPPTTLVADAIEERARKPQNPSENAESTRQVSQAPSILAVEAILQRGELVQPDQTSDDSSSDKT